MELAAVFVGQDKKQAYDACFRAVAARDALRFCRPPIADPPSAPPAVVSRDDAEWGFRDMRGADEWEVRFPDGMTLFGPCRRRLALTFKDGKVAAANVKYSVGGELPSLVPVACVVWCALAAIATFAFTWAVKRIAKKAPQAIPCACWALRLGIVLCWVVVPVQSYHAATMLLYENAFLAVATMLMFMSLSALGKASRNDCESAVAPASDGPSIPQPVANS